MVAAAPVNYLEFTFNNRANRAMAFEAVAATGEGVLETLNACARLLLAKYSKNPNSNVAGGGMSTTSDGLSISRRSAVASP